MNDWNLFLSRKIERDCKTVYLSFLFIMESLKNENKISEDDFQKFRKQILDTGNSCIRNLKDQVNEFELNLKK